MNVLAIGFSSASKSAQTSRMISSARVNMAAVDALDRPANGYVARWLTVPKTRQARALRDHGVLDAQ